MRSTVEDSVSETKTTLSIPSPRVGACLTLTSTVGFISAE